MVRSLRLLLLLAVSSSSSTQRSTHLVLGHILVDVALNEVLLLPHVLWEVWLRSAETDLAMTEIRHPPRKFSIKSGSILALLRNSNDALTSCMP